MKKKINIQDTLDAEELELQTYMDNLLESGQFVPDKKETARVKKLMQEAKKSPEITVSFTMSTGSDHYHKFLKLKNPSQFFEKTLSDALEKV